MPYGFVRMFICFLFFRHQGFRMITFDRQAGPFQNFGRSKVMVIGRSVSFTDPVRPPGGGVGRPKHPKIPLPKKKFVRFRTPGTFLKKKICREKNLDIFRPPPPPPIFFSVNKNSTTPPPSLQNTHLNPRAIINNPTIAV